MANYCWVVRFELGIDPSGLFFRSPKMPFSEYSRDVISVDIIKQGLLRPLGSKGNCILASAELKGLDGTISPGKVFPR